jgi:hypothetical protein
MKLFKRKTDDMFPVQGRIVGYILGVVGIVCLLDSPLTGLTLLVLSILIVFTHNGVALNLEAQAYKIYWGLLGFTFGTWKSLPALWRITLTNDDVVFRNQSHGTGLSSYSTNRKTALNFRINDRDYICVAKGKYKDILADALFLSDKLGLEIFDATLQKK